MTTFTNYKEAVKTKAKIIALILIVGHYETKLKKEVAYLKTLKKEKN